MMSGKEEDKFVNILADDDDEDIFGEPKTTSKATNDATPPFMTATTGDLFANNGRGLFQDVDDEIDLDADGSDPIGAELRLNEPVEEVLESEKELKVNGVKANGDQSINNDIKSDPIVSSASIHVPTTETTLFVQPPIPHPRPSTVQQVNDHDDANLSEYDIDVCITELEKRGDGMNAFVVYKLVTKMEQSVPGYAKGEYEVWRRFSDFLGLHEKLSTKHLHVGLFVPPAPEKSVVGMTKTKMSKGVEEDQSTAEFLEKRRSSLERFVRRIALHPTLVTDCDFRDFISFDGELPKSNSTVALSGAGMKRMFRSVGDVFSKITYHMNENDRWFEEKQNEVDDLDESLRKLHASVESLVMFRRELAGGTESFCKSMSLLASCEENTALARAFSQLAETQEKVGLLMHDQAEKDFYIFSEMLRYYLSLIGAVKEAFYERVKVWQNWQAAQQNLTKKREIKTRFELSGKTDKLPQAKLETTEAEKKVHELEEEFEKISKQIRKEMNRFSAQRIKDFKAILLQYLESLSLSQQQLIKYWEAFLPEARAIIT